MGKLSFIFLTLFVAINSHAQMVAHTEDGRRVLLRQDGTWKFADEQPAVKPEQIKIPANRKFLHPDFTTDVNADYYYEQQYDDFDEKTRTAVGVKIRQGFYLRFYYYSPGLLPKAVPDSVVMMFVSVSSSRQFTGETVLRLSLDGERVELGKFQRMTRLTSGGFREFNYKGIPLNTFLRILNADYVAGKLFNSDFVLNKEHCEALRDFASRMK